MSAIPVPTTREVAAHRAYATRLAAFGIIPPANVLRQMVECAPECGTTWEAGVVGVVRHAYGDVVLWTSRCPACQSDRTVSTEGGS